jgi:hypothetical protein
LTRIQRPTRLCSDASVASHYETNEEDELARAIGISTADVTDALLGYVLTHDVYDRDGLRFASKGDVLDEARLARWSNVALGEIHLLELEPGDVHEDAAGLRVAHVIAGSGLRISRPMQSRVDLIAEQKGLLRVDRDLLRAINRIEDVTVYTLLDRQPVVPGMPVASVKITPIAIPEARLAEAERVSAGAASPMLTLIPFQRRRVGVLAIGEHDPERRARFASAIERKLLWYGAELIDLRHVEEKAAEIAATFEGFLQAGADVLLLAGGNTIDPLDPIGLALPLIGAHIVHRGAPTRGSMFWLAQAGDVPIINLASCRMYTGKTVGDLILPLVLAGERVTPDDIIEIGYGGFPGSAASLRFPPYEIDAIEPE